MTGSSLSDSGRLRFFRRHEFSLLIAILAVALVTTLLDAQHNYFRDPRTSLIDITRQTTLLGIFSLGAAIVIIAGGIDLSSGSVICFSGTICGTILLLLAPEAMQSAGVPIGTGTIAIAIAGTLIVGLLIGSLHAWLITVVGLPPFVATLATLIGLRSFAWAICENVTEAVIGGRSTQIRIFDPAFRYLATSVWIPALIFAALALLCWVMLCRTVLGRHLYALGGNEEAARLSGIRTDRLKWFAYCLSAVFSSIAGILYIGEVGQAEPPTLGRGYELNAIAAAVVGGCSLQGGLGSIPGTVLGAFFLRTLIDGVAKIIKTGAQVYEGLIVGIVVVLAVAFTQSEKSSRGRTFFSGPLGLVAVLNLSILAAATAVLIGPWLLPKETSLDAVPLASLAFMTVAVLLLTTRLQNSIGKKRAAAATVCIVALVAGFALDRALPGYRLSAAVDFTRSLGGELQSLDVGYRVDLANSAVDDRSLKQLVSRLRYVPDVKEISLAGTRATKASLAALEKLPTLEKLDLTGTEITESDAAKLKRTIRSLEIER
ncbi:MAG: ABC transporter permease [Planctomycetaceae bacterium]